MPDDRNRSRRVVSFIVKTWARVLVYVNEHEEIDSQPYRDVMPDLIWSVQEELDASERSTLMRLLPKLVKRVKDGLQLIQMSEAESKQVMDELVAMHAQVLRTIQTVTTKQSTELVKLHQYYASLHIGFCSMIPKQRLPSMRRQCRTSACRRIAKI